MIIFLKTSNIIECADTYSYLRGFASHKNKRTTFTVMIRVY
jgi:hypothetical protein